MLERDVARDLVELVDESRGTRGTEALLEHRHASQDALEHVDVLALARSRVGVRPGAGVAVGSGVATATDKCVRSAEPAPEFGTDLGNDLLRRRRLVDVLTDL